MPRCPAPSGQLFASPRYRCTLTFIPQKLEESEEVLAALTNSNFGKLTIFQDQSSEPAASKKKVGCKVVSRSLFTEINLGTSLSLRQKLKLLS